MQTATITYKAPRAVNIGDVFYKIEHADYQVFREPCLVCLGKRELTVNGVTFRCPCCDSRNEVIGVSKYVVKRYRVYSIEADTNIDEWKASDYRRVTFSLYHKSGRGYYGSEHSKSEFREYDLAYYFNIPVADASEGSYKNYIYDDYKLAVAVADAFTAKELKELDEYNALHGTEHKAVFKTEHDKKSN